MFFCASEAQDDGILCQCLAKTHDLVSICIEQNTVFYHVFASRAQQKIVKKLFKNGPKT
jgi:hypothetical protein